MKQKKKEERKKSVLYESELRYWIRKTAQKKAEVFLLNKKGVAQSIGRK